MRSFANLLAERWKVAVPVGVALTAGLAWLAFGFFGIHTLFIDDKVDEAGPVFDSGAGAIVSEDGLTSPELDAAIEEVIATEGAPSEVEVEDEASMPAAAEVEVEDEASMPAAVEVITLVSGGFVGHAHPTNGEALVLTDGSEQRFLRFENFETDNGPDLNVYLVNGSADGDRDTYDDDFIDLGDLKGNIGPQNYEIPSDVDLTIYDTVVIWCVRFSVSFGAADLAAG